MAASERPLGLRPSRERMKLATEPSTHMGPGKLFLIFFPPQPLTGLQKKNEIYQNDIVTSLRILLFGLRSGKGEEENSSAVGSNS